MCSSKNITHILRSIAIKRLDSEKGCGQSLVKVGQTRSNLIDDLETVGLGEIHIQILINRIEEYGDKLVLVKFETNWKVRLSKHNHTST